MKYVSFYIKIAKYFLKQIKEQQLDFTGKNIFRLKLLLKELNVYTQHDSKECELIGTLYLALIQPVIQLLQHTDQHSSYFTQRELEYEIERIEEIINRLSS